MNKNSILLNFQKKIVEFRNKRDWKQFHNPKDSAISLNLEANEVLEHFQWKNDTEVKEYLNSHKKEVGDELSDVLFWVLLMSYDLDIDIEKAFLKKLEQNKKKYPIRKSKGFAKKYTDL